MTLNLEDLEETAQALTYRGGNEQMLALDAIALIAKLREAEAVIEAARESEARTKFIAGGRKPTHEDSSHTWRILTAYRPTNQEGGNDGT